MYKAAEADCVSAAHLLSTRCSETSLESLEHWLAKHDLAFGPLAWGPSCKLLCTSGFPYAYWSRPFCFCLNHLKQKTHVGIIKQKCISLRWRVKCREMKSNSYWWLNTVWFDLVLISCTPAGVSQKHVVLYVVYLNGSTSIWMQPLSVNQPTDQNLSWEWRLLQSFR